MSPAVTIYDVTLRDGAQGSRIKFSPLDQLRIVRDLDAFGVSYIEAGQPAANPKAAELFARARDMELAHAKMVAFGSTRHPRRPVEDDPNIKALLAADTQVVTIFAKSSPLHVREVLGVPLDANLAIIQESVAYLVSQNRRVFLDAEHFFDGYAEDPAYALASLDTARGAGAEILVLCDTNGARLPDEISSAIAAVQAHIPQAPLGIHTHNDLGCAVANTLAAVQHGVTQVQGTINGYGERSGNANLCTIVPAIQLRMGLPVVTPDQLARLTYLSHLVAELANMVPRDSDPFVGRDAFTHKGGMHADAVRKHRATYEHIKPESVGNRSHFPVSEVSGRASLLQKAEELGIHLDRDLAETRQILQRVKDLESQGYEFEGAEASLELLIRKARGMHRTFFRLRGYRVSVDQHSPDATSLSEATVRLELPGGNRMHTAAEGNGPVDALNNALRKALAGTYPELDSLRLEDYKVRILDAQAGTRAKTRVLIESSDGETSWATVGVSENIITASYEALVDSIEFKLLAARDPKNKA